MLYYLRECKYGGIHLGLPQGLLLLCSSSGVVEGNSTIADCPKRLIDMHKTFSAFSVFLFFCLLMLACRFPKFEKPVDTGENYVTPEFGIVFHEIDNEAQVFVNDQQVWQTDELLRADMDKVVVDLQPHLKRGENTINIKLLDHPGSSCLNNEWKVNYDLYSDGEIFDYWSQDSKYEMDCTEGVKVDKSHALTL